MKIQAEIFFLYEFWKSFVFLGSKQPQIWSNFRDSQEFNFFCKPYQNQNVDQIKLLANSFLRKVFFWNGLLCSFQSSSSGELDPRIIPKLLMKIFSSFYYNLRKVCVCMSVICSIFSCGMKCQVLCNPGPVNHQRRLRSSFF